MKYPLVALLLCVATLSACNRHDNAPADNAPAATVESAQTGVMLSADEIARLGIDTSPAQAAQYSKQTSGYAVVLAHDLIAQAVADVAMADAALQQSRAALARVKGLAGTPGAFSAETLEAAQRQAAADTAALTLAQRKLSATYGQGQPWRGRDGGAVLDEVANGTIKLVRATFPLGALPGASPSTLRFSRPDPNGKGESWQADAVWPAPADPNIPGRSLFALLKHADVGEGERLDVSAAAGSDETGLTVPESAVVVFDDHYWVYVESSPGHFERVPIETHRPIDMGYFVTSGIQADSHVVTAGAGLLLARETNPSSDAE